MSEKNKEDLGEFVEIEQSDIPDIINFEEHPIVIGKLVDFKQIKLEGKPVEYAILHKGDEVFGVWMSVGLEDLRRIKLNTVVKIESIGLEQKKKGTRYWRKFKISFNPKTGGFKPDKG